MLTKILTKYSLILCTSLLILSLGVSSFDIWDREWKDFSEVEQLETGEEESKERAEGNEVESEYFFISCYSLALDEAHKYVIPLKNRRVSSNWAMTHDPPPEFR